MEFKSLWKITVVLKIRHSQKYTENTTNDEKHGNTATASVFLCFSSVPTREVVLIFGPESD